MIHRLPPLLKINTRNSLIFNGVKIFMFDNPQLADLQHISLGEGEDFGTKNLQLS